MERTLSIIKPDGVRKGLTGVIIKRFIDEGFNIAGLRMIHMSRREAEGFYYVHRERPFFGSLTDFMTSGPCVVMVLEAEGAISKNRSIMGATNPAEADEGTIRKSYADNIEQNIVHGSDAEETAKSEIGYFFNGLQIF